MKRFDAFISYQHSKRDSWIAEKIHKYLEHYHIPKSIRLETGKKKFDRIFRDKEELGLAPDLTAEIYQALDSSDYLILICSSSSRKSKWVNKEVEYFLEHHTRDKVLIVLTDGEPEDAIPDCLLFDHGIHTEYLAADFRGDTLQAVKRKMKNEMLRIVSCMLVVSYDSLKQRHKTYRRKQFALLASIILVICSCFIGYSTYKQHQIALESHKKLVSQAEYASNTALNLLQNGDRDSALSEVLSIRDEKTNDLVSPYQTYVLNKALGSYKTGNWVEFAPVGSVGENVVSGDYSENGTYYYTLDEDSIVSCFSTDDKSLIWQINSDSISEAIEEESYRFSDEVSSEPELILPYGDDCLLIICSYQISEINSVSGEIQNIIPTQVSDLEVKTSLQNDILTLCSGNSDIYSYNLETGTQESLCHVFLLGEDPSETNSIEFSSYITYSFLSANSDHSLLAFGIDYGSLSYDSINGNMTEQEISPGLYLYDIKNNSIEYISENMTTQAEFYGEKYLISEECIDSDRYNAMYGKSYSAHQTMVYDISTGEISFEGEETVLCTSSAGILCKDFQSEDGTLQGIVTYVDDRITIMDLSSKQTLAQISYDSPITNISDWGERSFIVATESGWVQKVVLAGSSIYRIDFIALSSSVEFTNTSYADNSFASCIDGKMSFFEIQKDENLSCMNLSEKSSSTQSEIEFFNSEYGDLYLAAQGDYFDDNSILIFNQENDEQIYSYQCDEGLCIDDYSFYIENECIWFSFIDMKEESTDEDSITPILHLVNLSTKEEITIDCNDEKIKDDTILNNPQKHALLCETTDGSFILLKTDGSDIVDRKTIDLPGEVRRSYLSGDRNYAYLEVLNDQNLKTYYVFDFETESLSSLDGIIPTYEYSASTSTIMSESGASMCMYDGSCFYIVDCSTKELVSKIALNGDTGIGFNFFSSNSSNLNDKLLISDNSSILMYDVETGEFINSVTFSAEASYLYPEVGGLQIRTDANGNYFALERLDFVVDDIHGQGLGGIMIFSVDENLNMTPYAEATYGFADFEENRILIMHGNEIYSAPFYDNQTLIDKAENILKHSSEQTEEDSTTEQYSESVSSTSLFSSETNGSSTSDFTKETSDLDSETASSIGSSSDDNSLPKIWDIKEMTSSIEVSDQKDSYVLSFSNDQKKEIQKITSNILVKGELEDDTVLYYSVLKGRELVVNQQNQIVFDKNPEILGIKVSGTDYFVPFRNITETTNNNQRTWASGRNMINANLMDYWQNAKSYYFLMEEENNGTISYKISSSKDKTLLSFEDEAYIKNSHDITFISPGSDLSENSSSSGSIIPAEYLTGFSARLENFSFTSMDDFEIECMNTDQFDENFFGQICIYYNDGTIQTTDLFPLKNSQEETTPGNIVVDGVTYELHEDYASLISVDAEMVSLEIPSEIEGVPVKKIDSSAFNSDCQLTQISIPSSIESIAPGTMAFNRLVDIELEDGQKNFMIKDHFLMSTDGKRLLCAAKKLDENVVIPEGVEEIDSHAFYGYSYLKHIEFPDSLKVIGSYAFSNCLPEELELPDAIEYIGDAAFGNYYLSNYYGKSDIADISTIKLGKNIQYLGKNAFSSMCVRSYEIASDNPYYCSIDGVIYSKDKKTLILYPSGKNDSFFVPDGVETVDEYAFYYSGSYSDNVPDSWGLTELTLSDTVKTVKANNIPTNGNLVKVTLGSDFEEWENWDVLNYLDMTKETEIIQDADGSYYTKDGSMLISCAKTITEYTFPDTVKKICVGAFNSCDSLEKITIPADVNLDTDAAESFANDICKGYDFSVKEIDVEDGNPDFSSKDGVLMSQSGKTILYQFEQ